MGIATSTPRAWRACALLVLLLAGCTNYHAIVRRQGAPLYADEAATTIIARMKRLDDGAIGHSVPEGRMIPLHWRDLDGFAAKEDLRIFSYPANEEARWPAIAQNRREVVLEGKPWPEPTKQAVRESRVENGMTREMVELAWGRPTSVDALGQGGERWTWTRSEYEAQDAVAYRYGVGVSRFDYAYPYGWGVGYEYPYYEPVYYRAYYVKSRRLTVTFDERGTVTGWDTGQ
jgi:hypothetical protein